ncbi:MAG TPA: prolyl oligopeptidase family serine peptidase [Chloroflexota bacterium]|nr:prolyl oligopeptidase family serine peptidase [Chloroflexota bacterium]
MLTAPETRRDAVTEQLHGHEITDEYRWLENGTDPATVAWVEQQNAHTRAVLDAVPGRESIERRLTELLSIGTLTSPEPCNGRYFYTRRDAGQNQPVLYVREGPVGEDRPLLDVNLLSEEGLVALDWWYPSQDGAMVAYGTSENGNEVSTLQIIDVATGDILPDRIERTRAAAVAWLADHRGFYYTRYPRPGECPESEEMYHRRIFFHALGTDPSDDPLVFGADLPMEWWPSVSLSEDGRWLIITVSETFDRSQVWLRDLSRPDSALRQIAGGEDALFSAQVGGDTLYIHTNLDAPRFCVFAVDPEHPDREGWREIIPEGDDLLEQIALVGGRVAGVSLHNAVSRLTLYEPDGSPVREIPLPALGTVTMVTGSWGELDAFYAFESFAFPPTVYRLPTTSGEPTIWQQIEAPIDPDAYEVRQEWYASRDGTRIPMFLVQRRDLDRSGPHPTVLTAYGGFNISMTPVFTRTAFLLMDHGGIYAMPNLRGGGEFGEEWHRAGMLGNKQNVFDDFIAAAEYLIAQGYTDRQHLAASGGSNGGLLMGAALTQRPDLFRAVVSAVPLLDMLRYHHFQIARLWIPEYGAADDPEQFPFLYAYSPYHHVRQGESYPAVLLMAAEFDTRVDPLHARKMAARLQAANASEWPILLRIETNAGHGVGKPITKLVETQTDFWAFVFSQLGIEG